MLYKAVCMPKLSCIRKGDRSCRRMTKQEGKNRKQRQTPVIQLSSPASMLSLFLRYSSSPLRYIDLSSSPSAYRPGQLMKNMRSPATPPIETVITPRD